MTATLPDGTKLEGTPEEISKALSLMGTSKQAVPYYVPYQPIWVIPPYTQPYNPQPWYTISSNTIGTSVAENPKITYSVIN
jgi:hypothetical protein